jgi:deoxyribonuclease-4
MAKIRPLLGGHVSAAGGFDKALERGEAIGAETIQVFVSSPRAWLVPEPKADSLLRYQVKRKVSPIKNVYVHGTYLANLGSANPELVEKSRKSLADEFRIANAIGARAFIFHVGSRLGGPDVWLKQVIEIIKETLKKTPGKTFLAPENAAGGGDKLGNQPEELAAIMKGVKSSRLKFCIDTAHAFESGLIPEYTSAQLKKSFAQIDKVLGLENIVAFHINDSMTKAYSKHDRHENIGKGYIGLDGFRNLAKEKSVAHADWLLEVPGFDNMGPDKKNVDIIKSLF